VHTVKTTKECTFPATRWTDEGNGLIIVDLKVDAIERALAGIVKRQIVYFGFDIFILCRTSHINSLNFTI
jgi:hypothetical protein